MTEVDADCCRWKRFDFKYFCVVVKVLDSIHGFLAELFVFIIKFNITLAPFLFTVFSILFSSVSPKKAVLRPGSVT